MRGKSLIATAFLLCAATASPAEDWPCFLGPNGDASSSETGINKNWRAKPPKELWRVSLSDNGFAGPSVADGKVFIVDHEGDQDIVRAIDLKKGNDVWRFPYRDAGKHNWGFTQSTPAYDAGRLYTMSCEGKVHCIDAKTGRKRWMVDVKRQFGGKSGGWRYASSPLVDGRVLIVCPGGKNAAVALDKNTGRPLWASGGGGEKAGYATAVGATIGGRKQYVVFTGTSAVGVDARSGRMLWKHGWRTKHDVNASSPRVLGNNVFITSDYGRGCALLSITGASARVAWENKEMQSQFSTPVVHDKHIIGTTDPGRLVCLDPRSGRVVWQQRGFEKGGVCAVDGTLIVCDGKTGDVAMCELSTARYRELGRIKPLGGKSWTAPIVADKKLIVRNQKAMVCLDLR
ncbi:MAG: PQQ-binding-like beta-propeller repeat protein [Planctomycetota bacterium]|jgi:outer membrane protein assembly factor BamB